MVELNLRPWQAEAINKCLEWFSVQDIKQFLINAAPGAGKTICASVIAKRLIEMDKIDRVIVIAPRVEVVRQWSEEFQTVTGKFMMRVTGADKSIAVQNIDCCATWSSVQGASEQFKEVCDNQRTLVICDEHHHAAIEATWGRGAAGAFANAKYVVVLTGTPIRSDGKKTAWMAYDSAGRIDHPERGTYTLNYGEAVDLGYCRPITFHRHEGNFNVVLKDGETVSVNGSDDLGISEELKRINGIQKSLNYYALACRPIFEDDGQTPKRDSFQGSMLESGVAKLNEIREIMPDAGGLVIAPSIEVAEHMASLLEIIDGEKPTIVHNQISNTQDKIAAFRGTDKRWIVSVAMISEGVDIKRLRLMVYLPDAKTELSFRQSMGRVVRTMGKDDLTRAYVVMPSHEVFEQYARRVELEMSPSARKEQPRPSFKICKVCEEENPRDAAECSFCNEPFPEPEMPKTSCHECGAENPKTAHHCKKCGAKMKESFVIELRDAFRSGAIVRGMDLDEDTLKLSESVASDFKREILNSGDAVLVELIKKLPEESYARIYELVERSKQPTH
jgi:superfamily II DNA or RNA helicase